MKIFQSLKDWFEILKDTNPILSQMLAIALFFVILLILIGVANLPSLFIDDPAQQEQASQILGVVGWALAMIVHGFVQTVRRKDN